ncbi:D-alanyl-D-alanine carboxypeptidase [uncultured Clostridium sp.]|nr:D-alanyl-D-alanine carboxypeptidase [uncultured Clostridium sp.]
MEKGATVNIKDIERFKRFIRRFTVVLLMALLCCAVLMWMLSSLAGGEKQPSAAQNDVQRSNDVTSKGADAAQSSGETAQPVQGISPDPQAATAYCLTLVNGTCKMAQNSAQDLVSIREYGNGCYALGYSNLQGNREAVLALNEMFAAAQEAGFHNFVVQSAYRSYKKQETLFKEEIKKYTNQGYSGAQAEQLANRTLARPGESEHETGLAFDLMIRNTTSLYDFEGTQNEKWIKQHCAEYGFIIRFPPDKEEITGIASEPWHIRYVGKEHARCIMENKLCLEEYIKALKG